MSKEKIRLPGSIKFLALYFGGLALIQIPLIGLLVGLWAWFKSPLHLNRIEKIQQDDSEGKYIHWRPNMYKFCRIIRYLYLLGAILMTIVYLVYVGMIIYLVNQ